MAEWEKEIAELKTDIKYIREDISIMQKQVRDLNKHTNMGLGGIKVLLLVGAVIGSIWTVMKIMSGIK
jgi:hypothetical protein